ncbi:MULTISPECIES: DUF2345 domain-containing protein [Cupriavidus]
MISTPAFGLSLVQKRQAALLYHFTSLDYLQGLSTRIEGLLQYADYLLERRKVVELLLQAQHNTVRVEADRSVEVSASQQHVRMAANKHITLVCSDAYIKMADGNIELGMPGMLHRQGQQAQPGGAGILGTPAARLSSARHPLRRVPAHGSAGRQPDGAQRVMSMATHRIDRPSRYRRRWRRASTLIWPGCARFRG